MLTSISAKLLVYGLASILMLSLGWHLADRFRNPCPVCPPTTANTIQIDKKNRGTIDLNQLISEKRDTVRVYVLPQQILDELPTRWQRKIKQKFKPSIP